MNNLARSRPWLSDEKVVIGGWYLVYTALADGDLMLHIPGRRRELLSTLHAAGHKVALPAKERRR